MDPYLKSLHHELGIDSTILAKNRLSLCVQPALDQLEVVDIDFEGRPFILASPAAVAWRMMGGAASTDGVPLKPFSGFRSYLHQKKLIERHLANGRSLADVLTGTAIPGFSEHHSGRAIDLCAIDKTKLEQEFEFTDTFSWLTENAGRFKFRLSYPKNNTMGIIYEPWHWYFFG